MFGSGGTSIADIAAVTRNAGNDGFGNNGAWWVLIILFALWNRNGNFGNEGGQQCCNNGGNTAAYVDAAIQRGFDTQSITSALSGISQGICSLGYDQLSQINNTNNLISTTGNSIVREVQAAALAALQQTNDIISTQKDCCCKSETNFAELKYTNAKNTCEILTAIQQMGQTIMQNDNNNYRQLHDENVAAQLAAKDAKIAEQASLIQTLNLSASQSNQTETIIARVIAALNGNGCTCGAA